MDELNVDGPAIGNSGWGKVLARGALRYSFIAPWSPCWIFLQELITEPFELGVELPPCFLCLLMSILLDIVIFDQFRSAMISLQTEVAHNSMLFPCGRLGPDRTRCRTGWGAGGSGWKTCTFVLRLDDGWFPMATQLASFINQRTLNHKPTLWFFLLVTILNNQINSLPPRKELNTYRHHHRFHRNWLGLINLHRLIHSDDHRPNPRWWIHRSSSLTWDQTSILWNLADHPTPPHPRKPLPSPSPYLSYLA